MTTWREQTQVASAELYAEISNAPASFAAARSLEQARPGTFEANTLESLDALAWSRHDARSIVGSLPWLLLAEEILPGAPKSERQALTVELVNAMIANQIGHTQSLVAVQAPADDLVGGFVTSGGARTTATASSLRPALALAIVLRSPPDPLPAEVEQYWGEANQRSLRFTDQLQVNPEQAARAAVPARALGGIKRAPWSNVSTQCSLDPHPQRLSRNWQSQASPARRGGADNVAITGQG